MRVLPTVIRFGNGAQSSALLILNDATSDSRPRWAPRISHPCSLALRCQSETIIVVHCDQLLTTLNQQRSQFLHCQTRIWEAKIYFSRAKNRHGGGSISQQTRWWQTVASWLDVTSLHCYTLDIMSPRQHIEQGGAPIRGLVPWCTLTSMQKAFSHLSLFLASLFFLSF